ncbi:hypothetical protein [Flagellimonas aquimarina]|uniref:hypothetical protein n=1 Tax=Flagellimonas aquimarina TaxID=2201895 RepID=UPI001057E182|nr:hypothetical protein [Allomuricauda koreensis]
MKSVQTLSLLFTCSFCLSTWAQDVQNNKGLRFYEKLAKRDASYEQSMQLLGNQDESDYWIDQRNYERHLGKANFTSYLVYMKGKKDAYHEHVQTCDHKYRHSELYLEKAKEYLSLSNSDELLSLKSQNVVQSFTQKKKDNKPEHRK